MQYRHFIPFHARADLLKKAIESIEPLWEYTSIIDNTINGDLNLRGSWPVNIVRSPCPLTVPQSMNFMQRLARESNTDVWGYQHVDVSANENTARLFLAEVRKAADSGERWGVGFTHYDMMSFHSTEAVRVIGPWDTNFPCANYTSDVDFFHRLNLRKFIRIETHLPVTHMDGGSVTHRMPGHIQHHTVTFPLNAIYWRKKWNGLEISKAGWERPWNWYPVKTYGLQRTGTNVMDWLLKTNFTVDVLNEKQTGWKHGHVEEGDWYAFADIVLCVRHPVPWLEACYHYFKREFGLDATIDPKFAPDMTFQQFLTSPHYNFASPVDRWNRMHRHWLDEIPAERRIIVRVEDLVGTGQNAAVTAIARQFKLTLKGEIETQPRRVEVNGELKEEFKPTKTALVAFPPGVDWELVKSLGY